MEAEMEKLIKEKEQSQRMALVPLDVIPIAHLLAIGTTNAVASLTQTTSAE